MISLTRDRQSHGKVYHSLKGIPPGENGALDKPIRYLGTAEAILASVVRLETLDEFLPYFKRILLSKDESPAQVREELGKLPEANDEKNAELLKLADALVALVTENRRLTETAARLDEEIASKKARLAELHAREAALEKAIAADAPGHPLPKG
jgi:cell division protein FtsB